MKIIRSSLITALVVAILLIPMLASAVIFNAPAQNGVYYSNLIQFDVAYNSETNVCKYNRNNTGNVTYDCSELFVYDVPYNVGVVNFTIYAINSSNAVNVAHVIFEVNDPDTQAKAYVSFGTILFFTLLPFFFLSIAFLMKYLDTEKTNSFLSLQVFRIGFVIIAMIFVFYGYNAINLTIRQYVHSDVLTDTFSPWIYSWVFWIFLTIYMLYLIIKAFVIASGEKYDAGDEDEHY